MIRVFVGCAANGEDIESQMVLESSLRRHSSIDVDITWMKLSHDPKSLFSGWRTDLWATPFSGFRWAVPELCDFEGRAIYIDSDVIFRDDVLKLFRMPIDLGKVVVAKGGNQGWRFCVSLWDCALAKNYLPSIEYLKNNPTSHKETINFFKTNKELVQPFSNGNWNCVDGENYESVLDPDIKVLHYSSEAHQPQLRYAVPRLEKEKRKHWFDGQIKHHWRSDVLDLFDSELLIAIKSGYKLESYEPEYLYGEYNKATQRNYRSHQWAR